MMGYDWMIRLSLHFRSSLPFGQQGVKCVILDSFTQLSLSLSLPVTPSLSLCVFICMIVKDRNIGLVKDSDIYNVLEGN